MWRPFSYAVLWARHDHNITDYVVIMKTATIPVVCVCVRACVRVFSVIIRVHTLCWQTRLTKLLAVKKEVVGEVKAMNTEAERMVSLFSSCLVSVSATLELMLNCGHT